MANFYVTYGFGSNLAKRYSVVQGKDYRDARQLVDAVTKGKFAFMYSEEDFAGKAEKYNLTEVDLQPQVMGER
jgi:hypothetical protein